MVITSFISRKLLGRGLKMPTLSSIHILSVSILLMINRPERIWITYFLYVFMLLPRLLVWQIYYFLCDFYWRNSIFEVGNFIIVWILYVLGSCSFSFEHFCLWPCTCVGSKLETSVNFPSFSMPELCESKLI